jgi:Thioredoxin reductase
MLEKIIYATGAFIAIGHDPATSLFKNKIKMDNENYIITKPDSTETNIKGVYAAGDVKDKVFRQAVTAAGMGCMAALEAEKYICGKLLALTSFHSRIFFINNINSAFSSYKFAVFISSFC